MSSCNSPIYVGDTGTIFRMTIKQCIAGVESITDISTQTAMSFKFLKPNGVTELTVTPVLTTDGTDGLVQYTTITGDLDVPGVWCLQGIVTLPIGNFGTSILRFEVQARLG